MNMNVILCLDIRLKISLLFVYLLAENSEIIHDMEMKDRSSHKNHLNENASNEENCGLIKSPTFSKLQFPRENLSTVMLLG